MLTKEELKARINRLSYQAIGSEDTELSNERAEALDRYYGREYGDEIEGRSRIVSRDLAERIDWMVPQILNVFIKSGTICEFEPVGPEDEEAAKQEADYINHVIMKKNDGFLILHDWFKDALLMKNGYVKVWWDESEESIIEEHEQIDADTLTAILIHYGDDAEVIEQNETVVDTEFGPMSMYDIKICVTQKKGKICVAAVPAEEVRVHKNCAGDLDSSAFVEHKTTRTRTELIEMGMDKKFVYSLTAHEGGDNDQEEDARNTIVDETNYSQEVDRSMEEIEYRECYVRIDYNEDGKAELRKVVIVGDRIPDGGEWNREIEAQPFCYLTPKRMPHRHLGESINDEIQDLAQVKTVLERNTLDNIYGLVNVEYLVNENVNLDDFLTTKPLGIKRIEGRSPVDGSVRAVEKPNILDKILPLIQYFDGSMDRRSGVKPGEVELDPNQLQEVRQDVYSQSAAKGSTKIELIARLFAEQGVKRLIQKVHKLCRKYQVQQEIVKLRGRYITVDPREWKDRDDMTVNVGLGTGTEEARMKRVVVLSQAQDRLAQFGLVGPREAYNAFSDTVEALGLSTPNKYAMDPNSPEYQQMMANQQPPANPLAEVEMIKQQGAEKIAMLKEQAANARKQAELSQKQLEAAQRIQEEKDRALLTVDKSKHDIIQRAQRLDYDEKLFQMEQQIAKLNMEYQQAILSAQKEAEQIRSTSDAQRMSDQADYINKISEITKTLYEEKGEEPPEESPELGQLVNTLQSVMMQLSEKGERDDDETSRMQMLDRIISELNRPRRIVKDEAGEVVGLE